ncbi:MAG: DUF4412 domain-containing protein [Alphaproteobacteria bacterium]|nr:DUF4412 domain-containing protein [Alphaproteobacteria bacterium]
MKLNHLAICLTSFCFTLPTLAPAETTMPFWPTRDVTVVSTITNPTGNGPKEIQTTMLYQSAKQRMRINTDLAVAGQPVGYNIIDYKTHKATTVMPAMHMYIETTSSKMSIQDEIADPSIAKEKVGTSTVAGLPCSIWQIKANDNAGRGCVTDDGVVLSYEGNVKTKKNEPAQKITMLATSVNYGPLEDSLFVLPQGYTAFSPDSLNMLQGMIKSMKK